MISVDLLLLLDLISEVQVALELVEVHEFVLVGLLGEEALHVVLRVSLRVQHVRELFERDAAVVIRVALRELQHQPVLPAQTQKKTTVFTSRQKRSNTLFFGKCAKGVGSHGYSWFLGTKLDLTLAQCVAPQVAAEPSETRSKRVKTSLFHHN